MRWWSIALPLCSCAGVSALEDAGSRDAGAADATSPDAGPHDGGVADADPVDAAPGADRGYALAYSRRADGEYDVVLDDLFGGRRRVLTSSGSDELSPSWSPDGRRLVFATNRSGPWTLQVLELEDGAELMLASPGLDATLPAFSPDGHQIAFQGIRPGPSGGDRDLFVVSSTGGAARSLSSGPAQDGDPVWAPDGKTIYFVSNRAGPFEIYSVGLDGRGLRRVTTGSGVLGRPALDPAGGRIVYATGRLAQPGLVLRDLRTSDERTLSEEGDSEPAFSGDGRYLAFTTSRFGPPEIMALDLVAGGPPRRVTDEAASSTTPALRPL